MEAELYAATQGCTLLNSVYALFSELYFQGVKRVLAVDNTSAAAMLAGGHGSQRTRHLKIRANYVREAVEEGGPVVRHTPGSEQLADVSTKMQSKLRLHQLLGLWGFVGFAVNLVQTMKLKLLAALMMLAQCVCPARGDDGEEIKEPIQPTGWAELFFLLMLTSMATIVCWEVARYLYRAGNRWMRRYRKAKRLVEVSQLASSVARQEIAASSTSRATPTTPIVRRRTTARDTGSPPGSTTTSLPTSTASLTATTPLGSPLPDLPPLPQFQGDRKQREVAETQEECERVAVDTLQLMFCEDLKTGLRLQGLPVSGLKDDLVRRLSVPLVSSDVTNEQMRYVLYLWRSKSLSGRCKLRWEDINSKQRISRWIATVHGKTHEQVEP